MSECSEWRCGNRMIACWWKEADRELFYSSWELAKRDLFSNTYPRVIIFSVSFKNTNKGCAKADPPQVKRFRRWIRLRRKPWLKQVGRGRPRKARRVMWCRCATYIPPTHAPFPAPRSLWKAADFSVGVDVHVFGGRHGGQPGHAHHVA